MATKLENEALIEKIRKIVEDAAKHPDNHAKYSAWTHHIVPAIEYSKALAKKVGADEEIVEIATILHDLGSLKCGRERQDEHHITGSEIAEEILTSFDYPKDKIEKIKHCILSHRASQTIPRESLEAEVVASADAMSHFAYINDLFYLAYVIHGLETDPGTEFVLRKLEQSYRKLMPEAKEMIDAKYNAIKIVLSTNN